MNRNQQSLEKGLKDVLKEIKEDSITVKKLFSLLAGRGNPFLLILLSLPFCQPLQIPGFSTPFGLVIAFIGSRIAFGHCFLLPKKLLEKKISRKHLRIVIEKSLWIVKKLKKIIHPRLCFLASGPIMHRINGLAIMLLGLFLALPLPIPFTNLIAAWGIFLMSLGLLEDDGLFVMLSYLFIIVAFGALIFSLDLTVVFFRHYFSFRQLF